MAPRKSTKPAAAPEAGTPAAEPKARAKTRARKPAAAEAAPEAMIAHEMVAAPEAPAPVEPAPAKPARKPRTTKAAKPEAAPAPVPEVAVIEAAPAPVPAPAPACADALFTEPARRVLEAIQAGAAVELLFEDAEANPPRTFEPRQLIFDTFTKAWFVWGWDRRYNAERHHRLDLIAQVGPVEGMGRAAQGPYKEGTPANHIGGWLGGEPIHVKAILLKQWIFAVRQAPAPFPEFKLEELEEGKAQVSFTGTDLRAIARWAMQFGDGIQVVEPQRLQDRIKQVGITWGGKAAAERPAPPAPAKPQRQPEPQHHRPEHRAEHPAPERRKPEPPRHAPEPPRHAQEPSKPAAKPAKFEIRIDRL